MRAWHIQHSNLLRNVVVGGLLLMKSCWEKGIS